MKFCAKIGMLIVGIILGISIILGSVAAVILAPGMVGTVADKVDAFNPSEEIADKSILEYGKTVFDALAKLQETTFGTIEDTIGVNITNTLADALGLNADILRESTVGNIADNILNGYTITSMKEKFGLSLPDLPLFQDQEFLNKPIKEAFDYLSEQLNFDTMTVRELNEKFGVTLGDMLGKPEFLDTPINKLGEKISASPLHTFVDITLNVEVDRYNAEHVATATTIADVVYTSLADWKVGKTAFVPAEDGSNLGIESEYVYDNPADFFTTNFYFDNVVDGEGNVVKTAKDVQAEWMAAYNAVEGNQPIVEFWQYAIENKDLYDAVMSNNTDYIKAWTKTQWSQGREYIDAAEFEAWYLLNNVEGNDVYGKSIAEAMDIYYASLWANPTGDMATWQLNNADGTMAQYLDYLFVGVYGTTINYYDYMPDFVAPIAPTVVVTETDGKEAAAINSEYKATIPVASNKTLQYLYYAVVGSDGADGLNAYMNAMTLDNATEIKDADHVLLQRIKHEKISNIGSAVTEQVNNMALNELMTIITDADVEFENSLYVLTEQDRTEQIAILDQGSGAYDGVKADWDYFETKADQQQWIREQALVGNVYYDRLEWERDQKNAGYKLFATEAERSAEYDKYIAANPSSTTTIDQFGIVLEGIEATVDFAKPYAPEVKADYVAKTASNKMLQAIAKSTPSTLDEDISDLTLIDIFGEQNSGAMSLISGYTKLNDISTAMTEAMQTATMGKLMEVGILTNIDFSGLTSTQIETIKGLTIEGMVNAYINVLKDGYNPVAP